MFILNPPMPLINDSGKPLVNLGKFALVLAANFVLAYFGGPRLPSNIRF
jgi:hypothetical protein